MGVDGESISSMYGSQHDRTADLLGCSAQHDASNTKVSGSKGWGAFGLFKASLQPCRKAD